MRILYGIQLTGNGHINRSLRLIEKLRSLGNKVDICVSGSGGKLDFEYLVKYRGVSIFTNGKGGVNWIKTIFNLNLSRLFKDSFNLSKSKYDLIISDFEPVSSISSFFSKTCSISISNQNSIFNKRGNLFKKLFVRLFTLKSKRLSYSYEISSKDDFFMPINPSLTVSDNCDNFYLIYLPYFETRLILDVLSRFSNQRWKIYTSENCKSLFKSNIEIKQISKVEFCKDLVNCKGVITACGFSTTTEALYLKKKLFSVPLKGQFEQSLNCRSLKKLGVFTGSFTSLNLQKWIDCGTVIDWPYEDQTDLIIKRIFEIYGKN